MSKTTTANPVSSALARRSGVLVLALLFCAWWSGAAMAQGASRDCTLTLAPLNFGNYDPLETTMRSEEHTSELQSLMRISYAVFCLKKKNNIATKIAKTTSS